MKGTVIVGIVVIVLVVSVAAVALLELPFGPAPASTSGSGSSTGTLAVAVTDPLVASSGIKAVFLTYSNVGVAPVGGSSSDVTYLNQSGTLQVTDLDNVSQTIAVGSIPGGAYKSVVLVLSSSVVEVGDQNYTAALGSNVLRANATQDVPVSSSATAFCLVDMNTLVVATGSSLPSYAIVLSATALAPQTSAVSTNALSLGAQLTIGNESWWQALSSMRASLSITKVSLTNSSLSITVENTGTTADEISAVVLTGATGISAALPTSLAGSTLLQVSASGELSMAQLTQTALFHQGYVIDGGSSVTLTYRGALPGGIVDRADSVAVIGYEACASTTVSTSAAP